jgi:hypothetical protein
VFLSVVLARFPWTRGIAGKLAGYALTPLHTMWTAFVSYIPNMIFLVILYFVVRTVIRLARVFFESIEHGTIKLANFEPEWATPTYRIVRLLIVAFGVVMAYPFIPGSGSAAFKGVSLFLGVMFSLDFMMGSHKWHGVAPNDEQLELALAQLDETLGDY